MRLNVIYIIFYIINNFNTISVNKKWIEKEPQNVLDIQNIPVTLLTEKEVSRINVKNNPYKFVGNYFMGSNMDEQTEYNLKNAVINTYDDNTCFFNRQKFLESLNLIRFKHSVNIVKWNLDLENMAKIVALAIKERHDCYDSLLTKTWFIGELSHSAPERLTEKELLQKWYESAYGLNLENLKSNKSFNNVNGYNLSTLLWDNTKLVGCFKVCCPHRELTVCKFSPFLNENFLEFIQNHIRPNRFLIKHEEDE